MPVYRNRKKEILHIHIPKTGGSSISRAVEQYGGLVSFLKKSSVEQCGNVPPQHMNIWHTKQFFDLKKIKSFAVIRDPWHRLLSEYVWTQRKKIKKFSIDEGLNNYIRNKLLKINHSQHANHFLPQYHFVNEDVKLFKYDNWKLMSDFLGNELNFPGFNVSFKHYREQFRMRYTKPSIDILDRDCKIIFDDLYEKDVVLYNSL